MVESLTADRRRTLVTFGAAILVFVVGAFLHEGFASASSVKAIMVVASFVGIVAAGQTLVILVGGIDLSVPWVLNAAAVLFATASLGRDTRAAYAVLVALGLGAAVGLVGLISLLQAQNMPEYGRSIVYGVAILVVLLLFGREERT